MRDVTNKEGAGKKTRKIPAASNAKKNPPLNFPTRKLPRRSTRGVAPKAYGEFALYDDLEEDEEVRCPVRQRGKTAPAVAEPVAAPEPVAEAAAEVVAATATATDPPTQNDPTTESDKVVRDVVKEER